MKYLSKITLIFLILYSFEAKNILINNIVNITCDGQGSTTFGIEANSSESLNEITFFELEIGGYIASCSIPVNNPIDSTIPDTTEPTSNNGTEPESTETTESTESSEELDSSENRRILSESIILKGGKCELENIEDKIVNKKVNSISNDIYVNDLHVDLNECPKKEIDPIILNISFRQLNKFFYDPINQLINFYFYGLITGKLPKGYQITMTVYLIKNGFQDDKTKTAICSLTEDVNGEKPVQGNFYCTILNIPEKVTSFEYYSSKSIAGIPSDKTLLNPVLTEKSISKGELDDYSTGNSTIDIIPSFNITSIEPKKCKDTGEFTIKGNLSSELEYDIQFDLPFASPKITATCNIKKSKELINVEMNCKTKGNIPNEQIKIAQTSLLNNKKKELLLIEKYISLDKIECANSKLQIVEYPITFRQVNKFRKLNNNEFSFFFAGLTQKDLYKGAIIKILVVFVKEKGGKIEKKSQKEISCTLNSDVKPFNGGFAQADFYCQDGLEDDADSIEIISSNNITGINDELEDYQKNPKLTEEEIEKTKNNGGIGKVLDYSLEANKIDVVPIIQIISISNKNKCSDKGKIQFKAKFNGDMNQKLDFEIPLSYPSSSIKCTSPKAKANKEIFIDCKVQKEFNSINEIFIEPVIIKKKNKEILFASKALFNQLENINCADYNQKQIAIAKTKYYSNYTFVQTNSFNIVQNRILFNLIIYSLINQYSPTIKVTVTMTKKVSLLRNLEEIYEKDVVCTNERLGSYICNIDNTDIKNKNEVESFYIDSDNIPGFSETNTNPIEIDESIRSGKAINYSDPQIMKQVVPLLNVTKWNETQCKENGTFTMKGTIFNKEVYEEGKNAELNYINPSDSGAICSYSKANKNGLMNLTCHNKDYFEEETLIIGTQMVGGKFILNKTQSNDTMTCLISSEAYSEAQLEEIITNTYFNTKSSSSGLSGAAISAIVIVCFVVLVLIGLIIALVRKKNIPTTNQTNYNTSVIPVSTSSVNII